MPERTQVCAKTSTPELQHTNATPNRYLEALRHQVGPANKVSTERSSSEGPGLDEWTASSTSTQAHTDN